jgi:polysaccharide export outer membrane protein
MEGTLVGRRRTRLSSRLAWLLLLSLAGTPDAAWCQEVPGSSRATSRPPTASGPVEPPAPEGYTIGPGDVLQIVVWKEADLTRDVVVRADGQITVPLLGDVAAARHTPEELAESIGRGLGRFVNSPRVTVGVAQASARVYVIGMVGRSGDIPLGVPLTVVQALALAGGFREFARTDSILIVGRDRSSRPFNYKKFEDGRDFSQNVVLRAGDTIVVP